jgi:cytochrome c-type biogenesis protein CcmH/NrfG
MKISKKHVILISTAVLILLASIGMTLFLLFSNYQNIRLFKQAQNNFQRGDEESLSTAEAQLLEVIRNDSDNETAFIMLGEIASRRNNCVKEKCTN